MNNIFNKGSINNNKKEKNLMSSQGVYHKKRIQRII